MFNTVVGKQFSDWVNEAVEERHKGVCEKQNLLINLAPEIANAFLTSNAISSKLTHFNTFLIFFALLIT